MILNFSKNKLFQKMKTIKLKLKAKMRKKKKIKINFTCNVESVSDADDTEGEIQTMNQIFPFPLKESDKTLVSLEFRNGI